MQLWGHINLNIRNNIDYLVLTLLEIFSAEVFLAVLHAHGNIIGTVCSGISSAILCSTHGTDFMSATCSQWKQTSLSTWEENMKLWKDACRLQVMLKRITRLSLDINSLPDRLINPGEYEPQKNTELLSSQSQTMKSQEGWFLCTLMALCNHHAHSSDSYILQSLCLKVPS